MTKTIQKLNNNLQDVAHSGHAQDEIYIKVLDAVYKIGDIKPYEKPISGKKFWVIEAKPISEKSEV